MSQERRLKSSRYYVGPNRIGPADCIRCGIKAFLNRAIATQSHVAATFTA
jgi:hypothetical protein